MKLMSREWQQLDLIPLINQEKARLCHQWTNNLIDNALVRIIGNGGEKKKTVEKLTVAAFSMQILSGEWLWQDLIPLVD